MLVQRSAKIFERDPYGGYVAGDTWLYFAHSPALFGIALWGSPSSADMAALVRLLTRELARPPHAALVDASGLLEIRPDSFAELVDYFVNHHDRLARVVREAAVVMPLGMHRATVAGFFAVAPRPFPLTWWEAMDKAIQHLGFGVPGNVARDIAEAVTSLRTTRNIVTRSVELLRGGLADTTISGLAAGLDVSVRSLQRALASAGSSYSDLRRQVQLEQARLRLESSDDPVTIIALDVGFSTSQHFSAAFRKTYGCTPSSHRARFRSRG
jgi:AraC-like DNA-binding protein